MQTGCVLFVFGELNLFAVDFKSAAGNSVGISSYNLALIIGKIQMTVQTVEADRYIVHPAVFIGRIESLKRCAEGYNLKNDSVGIFNCKKPDLFAVGHISEK